MSPAYRVQELRANSNASTMSHSSRTLTQMSTSHTYKASLNSVRKAKSLTAPIQCVEQGRSKESKSDSKIRKQQQQQDEHQQVIHLHPHSQFLNHE